MAFEAADRRAWKAAGKVEAAPVEKAPTSKHKAAKKPTRARVNKNARGVNKSTAG